MGWSHNAAGATSPQACNHALAAKFQHDNEEEEEEHDDARDEDDDKGADYGGDDNMGFYPALTMLDHDDLVVAHLDDLCIDIWISVMIISERGYNNNV